MPQSLMLIVDAANVVGSVPDGWWHDRVGATRRLRDALTRIVDTGLPAPDAQGAALPGPLDVVLVVEGAATGVESVPGVRVHPAPGSGDDAIVDLLRGVTDQRAVVVTGDRELRERVSEHGASLLGPRSVPRR